MSTERKTPHDELIDFIYGTPAQADFVHPFLFTNELPMTPYYYVYRVGYGKPTIKHATLESAAKESERLAGQRPGDTFEILKCLGITRTVTPQTFWMDGVIPPHLDAASEYTPTCDHYVQDPYVCDMGGEPKGQCGNCGYKWYEHDLDAIPDSEKASAAAIKSQRKGNV